MKLLAKLFGRSVPAVQPTSLDDVNFKAEVLDEDGLVLVDVWSDNCPPCRQLEPVIMGLASKWAGRVKVAEMRAAGAPRTAAALRVRGTPTVIYFHRGAEVERVVGFRGSLYHNETIEHLLGKLEGGVEESRAEDGS